MVFPGPILAATTAADIPLPLVMPFALLLALIAVMPLAAKHWWEKYYPAVSLGLGALMGAYYLLGVPDGGATVAHTLEEYVSFICLIGSLFIVAGGIHIQVKGGATPLDNVIFLALGSAVANVIGTTGASIVLIRPWLRMNKIRLSAYHVVFFIFLVSNIGGALTPIGDPPLFLGFLNGVPFFWLVEHVLVVWLVTLGVMLAIFYAVDLRCFHRMPQALETGIKTTPETWQFEGTPNVLLLAALVAAVFLPAMFPLRETVMAVIALVSWFLTPKAVHQKNSFTFAPIKEVAVLFLGIFLTMMPALAYLSLHGREFGFDQPLEYYLASGGLSAVLDNAPTYLNFLQLAQATAIAAEPAAFANALGDPRAVVGVLLDTHPQYVVAISLGAVFFGALTYIGNGPNFMVKSIAEEVGAPCPNFARYLTHFSLPILLPVLVIVGWLFLR